MLLRKLCHYLQNMCFYLGLYTYGRKRTLCRLLKGRRRTKIKVFFLAGIWHIKGTIPTVNWCPIQGKSVTHLHNITETTGKIRPFAPSLFGEGFYLTSNEIKEISVFLLLSINNIALHCIGVWLFTTNKSNVLFANFIYTVRNTGTH